jgi:hypothetical protein
MAKLSMHLFWSEPSNFTFASFLRSGVFHRICAPMAKQQSGSSQVSFILPVQSIVYCLHDVAVKGMTSIGAEVGSCCSMKGNA